MKVKIETQIQSGKKIFFLDYSLEKGVWKNHGSYDSYDKALNGKAELLQEHITSPDCWCIPEYVGDGVYVHRETH